MIAQARDAGIDTFITGEGPHHTYFDAMEWGLNLIYAGHYATETLGVQASASHLGEQFDLDSGVPRSPYRSLRQCPLPSSWWEFESVSAPWKHSAEPIFLWLPVRCTPCWVRNWKQANPP